MSFFDTGSHKLFASGSLQTAVLLISACWVTRITGVSHQHLALLPFLELHMSGIKQYVLSLSGLFFFFLLKIRFWNSFVSQHISVSCLYCSVESFLIMTLCVYLIYNQCIFSSFQPGDIMNKSIINILKQTFFWVYTLIPLVILKKGVARLWVR
jgi:hypothetical protein